MKRRTAIMAALIALILLLPVYRETDDGGSREYAAVLYRITLRNTMTRQDGKAGYRTGMEIRVLGRVIYDDVRFVPSEAE